MSHQKSAPPMDADAISAMANGFRQSRILLTAYELGLFTVLGDAAMTSAEVADSLDTDPRATDRLLNACVALGLVRKQDDLFSNTASAAQFLSSSSPEYMAGLGHTAKLYETWGTLTRAVRVGHRIKDPFEDPDWIKPFIQAMHHRAEHSAPDLVSRLDLSGVQRVLDIGGGSGIFAMAFAKAREGLTCTILDQPDVVPLTRTYVAEHGFADRIDVIEGDYLTDSFPDGFDLVLLSAIVHINSFDENRDLVARAAKALVPGGQLAISDFVMDEDRVHPSFGSIFALNMLVNTKKGDTYTQTEMETWMQEAGLDTLERIDTGPATALMIGSKPE